MTIIAQTLDGRAILEALPIPACLLDEAQHVVLTNASFDSLRMSCAMLRVGAKLSLADSEADAQMKMKLRDISRHAQTNDTVFTQNRRCSESLWLKLNKLPHSNLILVSVFLPDMMTIDTDVVQMRLRRFFDLSLMESRSALMLAEGATAKEIARRRGVSVPTIRTQLAAVRDKMGVKTSLSVATLVAKLSMPTGLGADPSAALAFDEHERSPDRRVA